MASQGPNSPDVGTNVDNGGVAWVNPGNIVTSNDVRATITLDGITELSDYLVATDFDFTIPGGATIDGVAVGVECTAGAADDIDIIVAFLTKNGTTSVGTDQVVTPIRVNIGGDEIETIGGATNLWGTTLSPSEVNATTFGVMIQMQWVSGASVLAGVDHITMTVHYTDVVAGGQPMWTRRGGLWRPARIGVR